MAAASDWREQDVVRAAVVVLLAALGPAIRGMTNPAHAGTPSPICSNSDVLDWVRQNLREREPYARLLSGTVNEAPGAAGDVIRCSVCLRPFVYDPRRGDMVPVFRCEAHGYVVRSLTTGFVVLSVD